MDKGGAKVARVYPGPMRGLNTTRIQKFAENRPANATQHHDTVTMCTVCWPTRQHFNITRD